jgi:hypothetical protein
MRVDLLMQLEVLSSTFDVRRPTAVEVNVTQHIEVIKFTSIASDF